MNATRRSFLKFCGGATAGAMISPLPWKLLDDVSIWTQNWSWMAKPPRGAVSYAMTNCTLCPAGCGLRIRRIGEHAVSAWGLPGHPLSDGTACPAGFAAAQIPYHPTRIRGTARRGRGPEDPWQLVEPNTAIGEIGRKLATIRERGDVERVAVLDPRPGRALSVVYGEFLTAVGGGRILTLPGVRENSASALRDLVEAPGFAPGYDFEQAGVVISFGAPLFDGWRGAAPAPGLLPRSDGRPDRSLHVIQVETNGSRNTDLADSWLPIRPGTEAALALGLAHLVRRETGGKPSAGGPDNALRSAYEEQLKRHTPEHVAATTGIAVDLLRATARTLVKQGPAVAVGGGNPVAGPLGRGEELAVWGLNLELGGVTLRPDLPAVFGEPAATVTEPLWQIPDGSLDLLLVDGSLPEVPLPRGLLRRKMRNSDSLIVALSAFAAGPAAEADLIVPVLAPGEWRDDIPPRAMAARTSYALSSAVSTPPVPALHPADALGEVAVAAGLGSGWKRASKKHEAVLNRRLDALLDTGRGEIFDPKKNETKGLGLFTSRRKLEGILAGGGCWIAPGPAEPIAAPIWSTPDSEEAAAELAAAAGGRLPATKQSRPLSIVLAGPAVAVGAGPLPPAVNKLYRESNLMPGSGIARVNPATGQAIGCRDTRPARLETEFGSTPVVVIHDEAVMPDVVLVAAGPDPVNLGDPDNLIDSTVGILEICGAAERPVWRVTGATLREV